MPKKITKITPEQSARIGREQRERKLAREQAAKPAKRRRKKPDAWHNDSGPAFFRDPDGLDRDNLGVSEDF